VAGLGSCLGSLLGMSNGPYTCGVDPSGSQPYTSVTSGCISNNYVYYNVAVSYSTATASYVTVPAAVWGNWVNDYYVMTSDGIWQSWAQGMGSGAQGTQAAGAGQAQQQQAAWNQMAIRPYRAAEATRLAQEAAAQQQERWRQVEETKKIAVTAESTAEKLLAEHLDDKQLEQFRNHRYFEVIRDAGKRVYRIKHGWAGNIEVFEGGRLVETMCIHPSAQVPFSDNLLAQKLLLEADEQRFRRIANITRRAA